MHTHQQQSGSDRPVTFCGLMCPNNAATSGIARSSFSHSFFALAWISSPLGLASHIRVPGSFSGYYIRQTTSKIVTTRWRGKVGVSGTRHLEVANYWPWFYLKMFFFNLFLLLSRTCVRFDNLPDLFLRMLIEFSAVAEMGKCCPRWHVHHCTNKSETRFSTFQADTQPIFLEELIPKLNKICHNRATSESENTRTQLHRPAKFCYKFRASF